MNADKYDGKSALEGKIGLTPILMLLWMSVRCMSANGISLVRTSKKTIAKLYTSAEFVMLSTPNTSGSIHGVESTCSVWYTCPATLKGESL
jgi:hypothetical protein